MLFYVLLRFLLPLCLDSRCVTVVVVYLFQLAVQFLILRMALHLALFWLLRVVVVTDVGRLVLLSTSLQLEGRLFLQYRPFRFKYAHIVEFVSYVVNTTEYYEFWTMTCHCVAMASQWHTLRFNLAPCLLLEIKSPQILVFAIQIATTKDIHLVVEDARWRISSRCWHKTFRLDSLPFQLLQIQAPDGVAVSSCSPTFKTTKNIHFVLVHTRCVRVYGWFVTWCLSSHPLALLETIKRDFVCVCEAGNFASKNDHPTSIDDGGVIASASRVCILVIRR